MTTNDRDDDPYIVLVDGGARSPRDYQKKRGRGRISAGAGACLALCASSACVFLVSLGVFIWGPPELMTTMLGVPALTPNDFFYTRAAPVVLATGLGTLGFGIACVHVGGWRCTLFAVIACSPVCGVILYLILRSLWDSVGL